MYSAKNFKPGSEGMGKVLGHLEGEIMEALWKEPGSTGKEVFEEIRKSRSIAVTTVFTVLERLVKKGLVRKARGGPVFTFEAAQTRDELAKTVSRDVLKGVFDLWRGPAMASFVDIVASDDPEELERLSRLISSKQQELGRRSEE
ncbi:MAG: hypothetical protein BMS9Abin24_068 [Thermodesulfobacteriota bacterium]|nr:MAG: hypothetical protein BMS9Abin24_068 [Thermodesulfobacteriota bacterium]